MPVTVLIVDDSCVTRELTKVYLLTLRTMVIEASDGQEALVRARDQRPDLILADLRMPKLDGPGLCAAVRKDPAIAQIPIVIMTSSYTTDHVRTCVTAGASEVIAKPANLNTLSRVLERYTGSGQ